jgi:four helix bundle protein
MKGNRGIKITEYQDKEFVKFFVKDETEDTFTIGFERLWVWQKAFILMQEIHRLCKTLPKEEKFQIKNQIERSSSSVCDNITEGYSSYYYNDKIKGFNVARKEVGETQNHIRKIISKNYLDTKKGLSWIKKYEEVVRGINGFIRYIRSKKDSE